MNSKSNYREDINNSGKSKKTGVVSEAQLRATRKYLKEKVEDIRFRVPMGRKAIIKAHANKKGESVNAFINRAVTETIEKDNAAEQ